MGALVDRGLGGGVWPLVLSLLSACAALASGFVGRPGDAAGSALTVWTVDPLVKVFRDAQPGEAKEAVAEVARGEHASLQIVVRSEQAIKGLTAHVGALTSRMSGSERRLKDVSVRYVGYVLVSRGQAHPSSDRVRVPPAMFPDPLLEDTAVDVAAGEAQPVWITVHVPEDAKPGVYKATVRLSGEVEGKPVSADAPIYVHVYNARVGKSRLWIDNWFFIRSTGGVPAPEPNTPVYWNMVRKIARDLADHRQNVALIPVYNLARFDIDDDGTVKVDFSDFDKWVRIFIEEGVIGRIDGGGNGTRIEGWTGPYRAIIKAKEDGKLVDKVLPPDDPQVDKFLSQYLPMLTKHLKSKGWLDIFLFQVGDEPCDANADTFKALSAVVHKYAPELKRMDAVCGLAYEGALDVFVPEIDFLHPNYDYFKGLQRNGAELWMYTCCHPEGEYLNRFTELPLLKTRLMHWMNYRYGTTGYLHWGYNYWPTTRNPYEDASWLEGDYLPAGDAWIVYPGKDGPIDSIRWEAMRDGIADYGLLCTLAERDPEAAQRLAARHILDFDKYNCDVETFRNTRREMLELLSD
jgi:hypothetical protein